MQKINSFVPWLLLPCFYFPAATCAADTVPATATVPDSRTAADTAADTADVADTADNPATPAQQQIVRALQDGIIFEQQKRQLSNELALEKLRAELVKVRAEQFPQVMPQTLPSEAPASGAPAAAMASAPPAVVLVSQVAGVTRVGVMADGRLQLVPRHGTFSAGGKKYRLVTGKNNQLMVREAG